MPSPFMSSTDTSDASTRDHCASQLGSSPKLLPTRLFMTSNFTSAARAGALRYKSAMNTSDQATEVRAAATEGTV